MITQWKSIDIIEQSEDATQPTVIATSPTNGATNVNRDLDWITLTFDQEMNTNGYRSLRSDGNWCLSKEVQYYWDDDKRTVHLTRCSPEKLLPANQIINFTVNRDGDGFRSVNGVEAKTYKFSFKTSTVLALSLN